MPLFWLLSAADILVRKLGEGLWRTPKFVTRKLHLLLLMHYCTQEEQIYSLWKHTITASISRYYLSSKIWHYRSASPAGGFDTVWSSSDCNAIYYWNQLPIYRRKILLPSSDYFRQELWVLVDLYVKTNEFVSLSSAPRIIRNLSVLGRNRRDSSRGYGWIYYENESVSYLFFEI